MNTLKRMSALLTAVLCIGACNLSENQFNIHTNITAYAESDANIIKSGDWSYYVVGTENGTKNIAIVEYSGTDEYSLEIPSKIDKCSVTSIEGTPFAGNTLIEFIVIPESVKNIGDNILKDSIISDIIIHTDKYSMEFISDQYMAFKSNSLALVDFVVKGSSTVDVDVPETIGGRTVRYLNTSSVGPFNGKKIRSVRLPDTIEYFGRMAFTNSLVESVNIPKALRVIPNSTFKGCSNLKNVEFHEQLIVCKTAFNDTNVKLPDYLEYSEGSYRTENSYENILYNYGPWRIIVSGSKESGEYTAEIIGYDIEKDPDIQNSGADIVVPGFLWDIPIYAVSMNIDKDISLNSITFPSEITSLKSFSLNDKSSVKTIVIGSDNINIDINTFSSANIEEVVFKGSCTLGNNSFSECSNLKSVKFTGENATVDIGKSAFANCTSLNELIFDDNSVLNIDSFAFENCSSLKNLKINGKCNISSNSFRRCAGLESVEMTGEIELESNAFLDDTSLTDLTIDTRKTINGSAFSGCSNLMNINSEPAFDSVSGGFAPGMDDFLFNSFNNADNVGFLNLYISAQAKRIVDGCTDSSMSDIEKVKAIHDQVCKMVEYDHEDNNALKNQNDASIFMNDSTICEGYSRGYNLLLNAAGIESFYVYSNSHAWNVIKLGGHYFHSDTTWDDMESSYNWFLKSDDEMRQETASHSSWKIRVPSPMHDFQTGNLPECSYSMGDLNTDGQIGAADLVVMSNYLLGKTYINSNDIILADMDYNGSADVFDLMNIRNLVVE